MRGKLLAVGLGVVAAWVIHMRHDHSPASVPEVSFGDWSLRIPDVSAIEAYTTSESGHELGLVCGADCVVYLKTPQPCKAGDELRAGLRLDDDVVPLSLTCVDLSADGVANVRWIAGDAKLPKRLALAETHVVFARFEGKGRVNTVEFSADGVGLVAISALVLTAERARIADQHLSKSI